MKQFVIASIIASVAIAFSLGCWCTTVILFLGLGAGYAFLSSSGQAVTPPIAKDTSSSVHKSSSASLKTSSKPAEEPKVEKSSKDETLTRSPQTTSASNKENDSQTKAPQASESHDHTVPTEAPIVIDSSTLFSNPPTQESSVSPQVGDEDKDAVSEDKAEQTAILNYTIDLNDNSDTEEPAVQPAPESSAGSTVATTDNAPFETDAPSQDLDATNDLVDKSESKANNDDSGDQPNQNIESIDDDGVEDNHTGTGTLGDSQEADLDITQSQIIPKVEQQDNKDTPQGNSGDGDWLIVEDSNRQGGSQPEVPATASEVPVTAPETPKRPATPTNVSASTDQDQSTPQPTGGKTPGRTPEMKRSPSIFQRILS